MRPLITSAHEGMHLLVLRKIARLNLVKWMLIDIIVDAVLDKMIGEVKASKQSTSDVWQQAISQTTDL